MDVALTLCTGILLNLIYFLSLSIFVPDSHRAYYIQDRRDWVSIAAPLLYHGILLTWLFGGTPPAPSGNAVVGTVAYLAGMGLTVWAQRVNPYFAPTVKLPADIVEAGPYRFTNHPGYIGFGLMSGGMLVIAATFWGALCTGAYWTILLLRAFEEDRLLRRR